MPQPQVHSCSPAIRDSLGLRIRLNIESEDSLENPELHIFVPCPLQNWPTLPAFWLSKSKPPKQWAISSSNRPTSYVSSLRMKSSTITTINRPTKKVTTFRDDYVDLFRLEQLLESLFGEKEYTLRWREDKWTVLAAKELTDLEIKSVKV